MLSCVADPDGFGWRAAKRSIEVGSLVDEKERLPENQSLHGCPQGRGLIQRVRASRFQTDFPSPQNTGRVHWLGSKTNDTGDRNSRG